MNSPFPHHRYRRAVAAGLLKTLNNAARYMEFVSIFLDDEHSSTTYNINIIIETDHIFARRMTTHQPALEPKPDALLHLFALDVYWATNQKGAAESSRPHDKQLGYMIHRMHRPHPRSTSTWWHRCGRAEYSLATAVGCTQEANHGTRTRCFLRYNQNHSHVNEVFKTHHPYQVTRDKKTPNRQQDLRKRAQSHHKCQLNRLQYTQKTTNFGGINNPGAGTQ